AGTEKVHGAPLGADEIAATRKALGWTWGPFEIPGHVYKYWDAHERGAALQGDWDARFAQYRQAHPDLAADFTRRMAGELPEDFFERAREVVQATAARGQTLATRKASQQSIEAFAGILPEMLGGSADLTGSNF